MSETILKKILFSLGALIVIGFVTAPIPTGIVHDIFLILLWIVVIYLIWGRK